MWSCRWLVDPETSALRRPDRTHYVIDILPDLVRADYSDTGEGGEEVVIQVWIDPAYPEAWRDPALLAYAEAKKQPLLIRYNPQRAIFAAPPSRTEQRQWLIRESDMLMVEQSPTGSRLLDWLAKQ